MCAYLVCTLSMLYVHVQPFAFISALAAAGAERNWGGLARLLASTLTACEQNPIGAHTHMHFLLLFCVLCCVLLNLQPERRQLFGFAHNTCMQFVFCSIQQEHIDYDDGVALLSHCRVSQDLKNLDQQTYFSWVEMIHIVKAHQSFLLGEIYSKRYCAVFGNNRRVF
jgi:hypothetical protein